MKLFYENPVSTCVDNLTAIITYDIIDDYGRKRFDQEMEFTGSQSELRHRLKELRLMGAYNIEVDTEPCFYESKNMNENDVKYYHYGRSGESKRKEIADRFGKTFIPDDHILVCKDGKSINVQIGKKYKCTAFNGQRVEVVDIEDVSDDGSALLDVAWRNNRYTVASHQIYESKLHEGDIELYSEPAYIGPYGDEGWETNDDDYYNFKQLGLRTVHDVVDFYKDLSKRQIVARRGAYGVLGDIDWNVRHGYWDDRNTQAVIDALDSDPSFKFYGESLKRNKSKRLREQNVEIEVKHEGILEVPDGKNVDELPISHFEKLAKKKGLGKITKALNNLQVWNKNDDPKLSKWAGNMIDKLNKKFDKKESLLRLNEKDNFNGSITSAADYYYPRWKSEVMDSNQIRDELVRRFGHSEDFADEVIELILDKYDDDQRYWDEDDEYDESLMCKRLKKDEAVSRKRTSTRHRNDSSNSVGRFLDKQIKSGKIDKKQVTVVYDKNNNIMWLGKAGSYPLFMSNIEYRSSGYDADHPNELWINARSYTTPFEESFNSARFRNRKNRAIK